MFFPGQKYYSLGDSLTARHGQARENSPGGDKLVGYQEALVGRWGLALTNHGVGGETVVQGCPRLLKLDYRDVALVTIAYGVNDARTGVPLGAPGAGADAKHDGSTFCGAYRALLDKIYDDNPECRVLLLTPLQRLRVNAFGIDDRNANGDSLQDFADAVLAIGALYATRVCDMYRWSGVNQRNLQYYTVDGVHPNNRGYARMAAAVLAEAEKL